MLLSYKVPSVHLLYNVVQHELALYGLVGNLRGAVGNGILAGLRVVFPEQKQKDYIFKKIDPRRKQVPSYGNRSWSDA